MITEADLQHRNETYRCYCCPHCFNSYTYDEHVAEEPEYTKLKCKNCGEDFAACRGEIEVYYSGLIVEEEV